MIKKFLSCEGVEVLGKTKQKLINGSSQNHEYPECEPRDYFSPVVPTHEDLENCLNF